MINMYALTDRDSGYRNAYHYGHFHTKKEALEQSRYNPDAHFIVEFELVKGGWVPTGNSWRIEALSNGTTTPSPAGTDAILPTNNKEASS